LSVLNKENDDDDDDDDTKQHAIVSIQLNIVTCPTYPEQNPYETTLLQRFYNFPTLLSHCRTRTVFFSWGKMFEIRFPDNCEIDNFVQFVRTRSPQIHCED